MRTLFHTILALVFIQTGAYAQSPPPAQEYARPSPQSDAAFNTPQDEWKLRHYVDTASYSNMPELCEQYRAPSACYRDLAKETRNSSICNLLNDHQIEQCMWNVLYEDVYRERMRKVDRLEKNVTPYLLWFIIIATTLHLLWKRKPASVLLVAAPFAGIALLSAFSFAGNVTRVAVANPGDLMAYQLMLFPAAMVLVGIFIAVLIHRSRASTLFDRCIYMFLNACVLWIMYILYGVKGFHPAMPFIIISTLVIMLATFATWLAVFSRTLQKNSVSAPQ